MTSCGVLTLCPPNLDSLKVQSFDDFQLVVALKVLFHNHVTENTNQTSWEDLWRDCNNNTTSPMFLLRSYAQTLARVSLDR